jgi:glycosyltransferase involved in cell wall biosynthesis
MIDKSFQIILLSRLPVHGNVLYDEMRKQYDVAWINRRLSCKLSPANIPLVLFYEFFSMLFSKQVKNNKSVIVVHFISLDALIAIIFKKIRGCPVLLYAIGSDVQGITNSVHYSLLKMLVSRADKVLCVNSHIAHQIQQIRKNNDAIVLPTPFRPPISTRRNLRKEYDVISVGALEPFKKHDLLFQACFSLTSKTKIAIVGDGSCREHLESLAKKNSHHGIQFFGNIPHSEVWKELDRSKVFVNMSAREGLPASILEAIWCEIPVIVVSSPYVDDLTKMYQFRVMVSDRSSSSLALAIEKVLCDYEKWGEIASMNKDLLNDFTLNWEYTFTETLTQLIQN